EPTLSRSAYLDPEWFAREQEKVMWDQWFCVGRAEEVPAHGDHLVCNVAGESIIVTRGRDGGLSAYVNLCRHRGSVLTDAEGKPAQTRIGPTGTFKGSIQCPYHAWTYSFDCRLRAAPHLDESDGLRKEDLPLHHVATETWGGFVWVHLSPERAGSLADQFQGTEGYLANYPLADLVPTDRIVYEVAANWKAIVENYNECYHCGPVHPELVELVPAFRTRGGSEITWDEGVPHREGAWTFTATGTSNRRPFPGLTPQEQERHKGQLIYPNLMLSLSADHVAAFTLWPEAPDRTTVVCDFLFHPDEVARPEFDASDAVEFWDVVNRQDWRICELVQRGMGSRRFTTGFYAPMEDYSLDIRRYLDGLL
ncbi:MAG TPA: aromatic ring-hydroxylating dioxygenase subunit alpha, partial [Acidimicrobiia bacterium]|nr:aromatic ring-hydroxylating dioxygenase subunit alpha [Acidimicrobiia bacterium]